MEYREVLLDTVQLSKGKAVGWEINSFRKAIFAFSCISYQASTAHLDQYFVT